VRTGPSRGRDCREGSLALVIIATTTGLTPIMTYAPLGLGEQVLFWFCIAISQSLHISLYYATRTIYFKQWVLTPAIVATAVYVLENSSKYLDGTTRRTIILHANGARVVHVLYSMLFLIFLEPSFPDFWRRVKDEESRESEKDKDPYNFSLGRKVGWTLDLYQSPRGVGWTHEPTKALPPRPNCSRSVFICSRLFGALIYFLVYDFSVTHQFRNPSFDTRVHQPSDGPETYIRCQPLLRRIPDIISWGLTFISGTTLLYTALAVISVGLRLSEPAEWPHIMGSFQECYTIRRFWGLVIALSYQPPILTFYSL
jgi:hypothetical protein